jgi:hypothetical protein
MTQIAKCRELANLYFEGRIDIDTLNRELDRLFGEQFKLF